jgi:5-methylcytosine-specific restriction enzyme subunit McrC
MVRGGLRPDRLECRYDDFTADNDYNRALKAALSVIRHRVTGDSRLHRRWLELTAALDDVALLPFRSGDVNRILLDRQSEHYRRALQWASLILDVLLPNLRARRLDAPDLLFDMNLLFQSAVASTLARRAKASTQVTVHAQDSGAFLASHVTDPKRRAFGLRPDIVIRQADRVVAVADTKWTRVAITADGHLLPAEQHVYQMQAYASVYACDHFALIYPWYSGLKDAVPSAFVLPSAADRTVVLSVLCVDCRREDLPVATPVVHSPLPRLFAGEQLASI